LARRLGTLDAVIIGLGAMIGAGVFSAVGPAADAAGSGLLLGLALAGFVALCNATSSAQLAALYPKSGGTYVYGRERLGHFWGYLAGWAFVVGKLASCAAMALTFGNYLDSDVARPLAIAAVVALGVVNYYGIEKTALLTRAIVTLVIASLAFVAAACLFGGSPDPDNLTPLIDDQYGLRGILEAGGLLFFAFAGYARIATLGEEVTDPAQVIPRAIPIALAVALGVYLVVCLATLLAVGPAVLANSEAPLVSAVQATNAADLAWVVRAGAAIASLGVLLSLMAGVSRTLFAMASKGDMPGVLAHVHHRYKVPDRAELVVAAFVIGVVVLVDVRGAIGFSSFGVLLYYAIANASAFTLAREDRRWPRALTVLGVAGCLLLAFSLPWESVLAGAAVLAIGVLVFGLNRVVTRRRHSGGS
jgi:APA family basic amino acid/polyamine antiporter